MADDDDPNEVVDLNDWLKGKSTSYGRQRFAEAAASFREAAAQCRRSASKKAELREGVPELLDINAAITELLKALLA
jgi:hypothetical protein